MNYTKTIREFCRQNPGKIFDVSYMGTTYFTMVPYKTMLKILNRLEIEGLVSKTSKGVYKINGNDIDDHAAIFEAYVDSYKGLAVGYEMYNYYDISDYVDYIVTIYTNNIFTKTKNVGNYHLIRCDLTFFPEFSDLITSLELIENGNKIKQINYIRYSEERNQCLKCYKDENLSKILENIRYQYSTIVTLSELLDELGIKQDAVNIYKKVMTANEQ